MKKKIRIWTIRLTAALLFAVALLVVIVLNPSLTYAGKTVHHNYTIFHNQPPEPSLLAYLDRATELVSHSEYYDPHWKLDICLDEGSYPAVTEKLWGRAFASGFYNKVVLMQETNYKENRVVLNGYGWNLEQVLAHEMIHCFQFHKRGLWKSKPVASIPDWKWEGYAEYISRRHRDQKDLRQNIDRMIRVEKTDHNGWIQFEDGSGTLLLYYRYWLLVQYCMDVRKMRYDQVIDEEIPQDAVWKQMMEWYQG